MAIQNCQFCGLQLRQKSKFCPLCERLNNEFHQLGIADFPPLGVICMMDRVYRAAIAIIASVSRGGHAHYADKLFVTQCIVACANGGNFGSVDGSDTRLKICQMAACKIKCLVERIKYMYNHMSPP